LERPRTPTSATKIVGGRRHGLSVAFDLPTLMGRDPDHELSLGEVGKCGVNVASLADMETLFDGSIWPQSRRR
jgi:methylmalonyl-CoA mutase N-terminal domain/subunit